jgi:putative ABC transport system ATP-binding protein
MTAQLETQGLQLSFGSTTALDGVWLDVAAGEVVAVMGPSGSGKSTLLHCLAGILRPDRGRVLFDGEDLASWSERQRSDLRLRRFGFVFQFGDLVSELTLRENVELPLRLTGHRVGSARKRAHELLDRLDIDHVADRRAGSVSGGQAQRAAVARALATEPAVLFADEPTGALDSVAGEAVLQAMLDLSTESGSTVLLITHDHRVAAYADRVIVMRDGRIAVPENEPAC